MDGVTEVLRIPINNLRHRSTAAKWKPLDQWSHDDSSSSSRRLFITWSIGWKGWGNNNKDRWLRGERWKEMEEILRKHETRAAVWWETGLERCLWLTPPSHHHSLSTHDLWPQGSPASPAPFPYPRGGQAIDQTDYYQNPGCLSGCLLVSL